MSTDSAGRHDGHGTRPIVVTGAAGQLGACVVAVLSAEWRTVPLVRQALDLTDTRAVRRAIRDLAPWAVVNCAAYNDVDGAESDAQAALATNAFAVQALARAAADCGAVLVHYGSDFVFDGESERPYVESDRPSPQSVYAASKLMGEWFAADAPAWYVLRVESLFGGQRPKGSLDGLVDRIVAGERARVFRDRTVSPSYAWDVAAATRGLLHRRAPSGVYHCVNSGAATWLEVAEEITRQLGIAAALDPITLAEANLRARRPRYCALDNGKLAAAGVAMPSWQDALRRALAAREQSGQLWQKKH